MPTTHCRCGSPGGPGNKYILSCGQGPPSHARVRRDIRLQDYRVSFMNSTVTRRNNRMRLASFNGNLLVERPKGMKSALLHRSRKRMHLTTRLLEYSFYVTLPCNCYSITRWRLAISRRPVIIQAYKRLTCSTGQRLISADNSLRYSCKIAWPFESSATS